MAKPVAKAKAKARGSKVISMGLVGMQYRVKKDVRKFMKLHVPFTVAVKREPTNEKDENAIAIWVTGDIPYKGMKLGYLRKEVAKVWAPKLDSGRAKIQKAELYDLDPERGEAELLITLKVSQK